MTVTSRGGPSVSSQRARALVFVRQRQIDQIAGHRDVVGVARFQIAGDGIENFGPMDVFAFALPVDEAEPALAHKLRKPRPRRRQMQVGQMGESEHPRFSIADTA